MKENYITRPAVTVEERIVKRILESLTNSSWAENNPKALRELFEYRQDLEGDVTAVLEDSTIKALRKVSTRK